MAWGGKTASNAAVLAVLMVLCGLFSFRVSAVPEADAGGAGDCGGGERGRGEDSSQRAAVRRSTWGRKDDDKLQ